MRDWDDLRIFLSVARTESLSGAGKELRLDPATVGRRIARLEQALGTILFRRSPQGYVATDAGIRLLQHAEAAERALSGAKSELAGEEEELRGTVRLGAPDGCATFLLPNVTQRIVSAHPGLELQIVALPRVFNLSKREADLAIAVSRPTAGRLKAERIFDYQLLLAASRDYLAAHPPIEHPRDLGRHPLVGYIPDMIFDRELDYLKELGVSRVDLGSNSVPVQIAWLRASAGVGVVHDFALKDAPELEVVLRDHFALTRSFWLVRHSDDARVERLNRFAALLADEMRREIAARTQS